MNKLKPCPICGSRPRYWVWNYGAIVECWCQDHRIQCEGKTLDEAVEAWERRTTEQPEIIHCKDCKYSTHEPCDGFDNDYICNMTPFSRSEGGRMPEEFCSRGERKE